MRERLEYALLWPWIKLLGILPRSLARTIGISLGLTVYAVHGRLRRVGFRNLTIAFPEMSQPDRRRIVRGEFKRRSKDQLLNLEIRVEAVGNL